MKINEYVLVTKQTSNLYRRRCRIVEKLKDGTVEKFVVYSEGLDEKEILFISDFELSKF